MDKLGNVFAEYLTVLTSYPVFFFQFFFMIVARHTIKDNPGKVSAEFYNTIR